MGPELCVRPGGDGTVVSVSGDVDICTASPLEDVLLRTMHERGPRLLLDLSGVSFMDCAGLRAIMTTRRRAELRGGSVRLIAVSAAVRRIVDLAGARDSFPVQDPVSLA
jgi:anti-anti-sigma factor